MDTYHKFFSQLSANERTLLAMQLDKANPRGAITEWDSKSSTDGIDASYITRIKAAAAAANLSNKVDVLFEDRQVTPAPAATPKLTPMNTVDSQPTKPKAPILPQSAETKAQVPIAPQQPKHPAPAAKAKAKPVVKPSGNAPKLQPGAQKSAVMPQPANPAPQQQSAVAESFAGKKAAVAGIFGDNSPASHAPKIHRGYASNRGSALNVFDSGFKMGPKEEIKHLEYIYTVFTDLTNARDQYGNVTHSDIWKAFLEIIWNQDGPMMDILSQLKNDNSLLNESSFKELKQSMLRIARVLLWASDKVNDVFSSQPGYDKTGQARLIAKQDAIKHSFNTDNMDLFTYLGLDQTYGARGYDAKNSNSPTEFFLEEAKDPYGTGLNVIIHMCAFYEKADKQNEAFKLFKGFCSSIVNNQVPQGKEEVKGFAQQGLNMTTANFVRMKALMTNMQRFIVSLEGKKKFA